MSSTTQTSNFGESIFDSPSVFNFFAPQFVQPGTLAQNGLVAPGVPDHDGYDDDFIGEQNA